MHRTIVLATAAKLTAEDRNEQHGDAVEQHSCAGEMLRAYMLRSGDKEYPLSHEIAIMQVITKISRIACGAPGNMDNYVDGAAYLAIAAECLGEEEGYMDPGDGVPSPGDLPSKNLTATEAVVKAQEARKKRK
jgi:hypothetical protein